MLTATPKDKERVIEILMFAFEQNLSVNYLIQQDDKKLKRLKGLMEYAYKVANKFGKVVISEDRNACALVLFTDRKRFSVAAIVWDLKLIFATLGPGKLFKILKRQALINRYHPKSKFYYLWFIGVHPVHKQLGIGSTLLTDLLIDAEEKKRLIYLETSAPINIPWYEKHGFKLFNELNLGYKLFFMKQNTIL